MKPPAAAQASKLLVQLAVPSGPESLCVKEAPLLVQGPPPLAHQPCPHGHQLTTHPASVAGASVWFTAAPHRPIPAGTSSRCKMHPGKNNPALQNLSGGLMGPEGGGSRLQAWGPFSAPPRGGSTYLPSYCGAGIDKPFQYLFTEKIHRSQGMTFNSNIQRIKLSESSPHYPMPSTILLPGTHFGPVRGISLVLGGIFCSWFNSFHNCHIGHHIQSIFFSK